MVADEWMLIGRYPSWFPAVASRAGVLGAGSGDIRARGAFSVNVILSPQRADRK